MTRDPHPGEYEEMLATFADRIYGARRRFLRDNFEGYVEDTYYYRQDGGYYCWPAQTDGRFEGFTNLTEAEATIVDELEGEGFDLLGVGASRLVCECPDALGENLVVKIGRCGMGERFATGRVKNLVEYRTATATEDLPIVPSRYCDPVGRYALYPKAAPLGDVEETALSATVDELCTALPDIRRAEVSERENIGRLDGELRVLDYSEFDDFEYPLGVPDHIDTAALIREIDRLRKRGEKLDIQTQGTLVAASSSD